MSLYLMTSSHGNISVLLALCAGNSPVPGEFPAQRPVTRSFDVFFDLRLNKRLNKQQSPGWWFETLSSPLWRHSNVMRSFLYHTCQGYLTWNIENNSYANWLENCLFRITATRPRAHDLTLTQKILPLLTLFEKHFINTQHLYRRIMRW